MNKNTLKTLFFICLGLFANSAHANDLPQFAMPVDCTLNEDCWLINYVDVDPSENVDKDYTCGAKTYEGHKGTDFAIRSRVEMNKGVDVLAAKDGKVLRFRDGEDDKDKTDAEYEAIRSKNKDCGNGVILDHGNGLLTYYCHLKQNSIVVKPGDQVKEGQKLAHIGQSGYAEFPHLHFTVIWEGGHIDPFTGLLKEDGCGKFKENLWKDEMTYDPYSVFDGGFTGGVPDFTAIKAGQEIVKSLQASELNSFVYWAAFYHAEAGDKITLTIRDPNGETFAERSETLENSRKRPSYYYTGRRLNGKNIPTGRYVGTIMYEKKGHAPKSFEHSVDVQ